MRLAILASGYGSNLQAILDAIERKEIDGRVEIVISDVEDAYALERARKHGIESVYINPGNTRKEDFDGVIAGLLQERQIDLVILAVHAPFVTSVC